MSAKKRLAPMMSSANPNWQTPKRILDLVREVGGGLIGLDPCTTPENPCDAHLHYSAGGLQLSWAPVGPGLVYANPPYGRGVAAWVKKCATEAAMGVEIAALLPARPDTRWWHDYVASADAVCFFKGRITFAGAKHGAPFPSAMIYWGDREKAFRRVFAGHGWIP